MATTIWRRLNMHRDHRWAQPRMSEYVDGELGDRHSRRLAAHEAICPDCGRVLRTLRTTLAALGQLGRQPVESEDAVDRALERAVGRGELGER